MFKQRISHFIGKERLFAPGDKILVALSGGADSVALLRVLLSLGYDCEAAHCNFHLRGEESDRDERSVRELCNLLHTPLHTVGFDTEDYARQKKISIEMAARDLRYRWFDDMRNIRHTAVVAVAHHQDDSVETVLLNLVRGTGINGLRGIRPRNGHIVRPLLCVSRSEILDYLAHIGQAYVTDSTNLQNEYTRNKIRLDILPLMQTINPSVKKGIIATASHLNEVWAIYHLTIEEGKKRVLSGKRIDIAALLKEPSPRALLFEIVSPLGFTPSQTDDIFNSLKGQPGKVFDSAAKGYRIIKDREALIIKGRSGQEEEDTPPFRLVYEESDYTPTFVIPREKETVCFDADKLSEQLTVRRWEKGDVFFPFGMGGKKKLVSDYLTDRKFSLDRKKEQWVLCCGEKIAWLVGERADDRFRVDEGTGRVLVVRKLPGRRSEGSSSEETDELRVES